jgi:hypothetical protein
MFGESHNVTFKPKRCRPFFDVLKETLDASGQCFNKRAHLFIENEGEGSVPGMTPIHKDIMAELMQQDDGPLDLYRLMVNDHSHKDFSIVVHAMDIFHRHRGGASYDYQFRLRCWEACVAINKHFALGADVPDEQVLSDVDLVKLIQDLTCRVLKSQAVDARLVDEHVGLTNSYMKRFLRDYEREEYNKDGLCLLVFGKIVQMCGDVLTVHAMLNVEKCGVIIGYWGAEHLATQCILLRKVGYKVVDSIQGGENSAYFKIGVDLRMYPSLYPQEWDL